MIAQIFNGPGEQINLKSMTSELNQVEWRQMEKTWADALKDGKQVEVEITPIFEGESLRPVAFEVNYSIGDKKTKVIFEN